MHPTDNPHNNERVESEVYVTFFSDDVVNHMCKLCSDMGDAFATKSEAGLAVHLAEHALGVIAQRWAALGHAPPDVDHEHPVEALPLESMIATLAHHLPAGTTTTRGIEAREVAELQARHLLAAGYQLVGYVAGRFITAGDGVAYGPFRPATPAAGGPGEPAAPTDHQPPSAPVRGPHSADVEDAMRREFGDLGSG
jgi:hypothetical protein